MTIARNLGLWDIDPKRVMNWAVDQIGNMQDESRLGQTDYAAVVGEYLLKHNANTLVINRHSTSKSGIAAMPISMPRGAILVRFEPDTKLIHVLRTSLKAFCVERQITFTDLLDKLHKEGSFVQSARVRLDAGTDMQSPPVEALLFDADKFGISPIVGDES